MKFSKNEGDTDRIIRLIVAVALAAVGYFLLNGTLQIVFYVVAVISLFTALTGFCGLYTLLHINTCKTCHKK